jgi:hypothetical protein
MIDTLKVFVQSGRVVEFQLSGGEGMAHTIWTLSETSPGWYYGSCDADGGGERCIRDASLDEALNRMNSNEFIQRPWRKLMALTDVTEAKIREIHGYGHIQIEMHLRENEDKS